MTTKLKLPPKPPVVDFVAHYLWMQDADENKRTRADLTNHVAAWGRACAKAAINFAIAEIDALRLCEKDVKWDNEESRQIGEGNAFNMAIEHSLKALHNIKIEMSRDAARKL